MLNLVQLSNLSDGLLDSLIEDRAQQIHQLRTERRRRINKVQIDSIINCPYCIKTVKYLCPEHDTVNVQPKH